MADADRGREKPSGRKSAERRRMTVLKGAAEER